MPTPTMCDRCGGFDTEPKTHSLSGRSEHIECPANEGTHNG